MKNLAIRVQTFVSFFARLAPIVLFAVLFMAQTALAQVPPPLGKAQTFAVLGGTTVTNTGSTVVTGDLGLSPGSSVTGFPPGTVVGGSIHATDALAGQAQIANTNAYGDLAGQPCTTTFTVPTDLSGLTLAPGVYCFDSTAGLTGTVTLDAGGVTTAAWVFKIGSALTTGSGSVVRLVNGAQNCNVFWQVGSSATIGTSSTFVGSILALTSITLTTNAAIFGRVLAQNGAVTMDSNTVAVPVCATQSVAPTLGKAFNPATINAGGTSTLTITLSNASTTSASLTDPLTDILPIGVVTSGSASTTCTGGAASSTSSEVTLTGGSIAAGASCTLTVGVTAPAGGNFINSLAAGALTTSNGSNVGPAVATLTVNTPIVTPTLGKAFNPATIVAGHTSILTITLSNASSTSASLTEPLVDTMPTGVVIDASPAPSNTCGGTASATASEVNLSGGSIAAGGSCTVTVTVTASAGGSYFNSLAAGALVTSNGSNVAPAVATLTVNSPGATPTLGKAFNPATINPGGISMLIITLSNIGITPASLTEPLVDTMPTGVVTSGSASTTCIGGTASSTASEVTLTGGSIAAGGSCTVTVNVTAPAGGNYFNSLATGALVTSNGGNAAPAIATLTVSAPSPVTLGKSFNPATITAGGTSLLTITLTNTGATIASLTTALIDTLPSGLVSIGNVSSTCIPPGTNGTQAAILMGGFGIPISPKHNPSPMWFISSTSTVGLAEGSIPANGSCTVTVNVTAALAGSYFNSLAAGALQTNNGNNAAPAVATLTVLPVITMPTLSKSFNPATITAGGTSLLTITLTNTGATTASLTAALIDTLPSGLVSIGNVSSTCIPPGTTGTQAAILMGGFGIPISPKHNPSPMWFVSSPSTVGLAEGSIPANSSCTVTVNVTSAGAGSYTNTLLVGALQTNLGSNTSAASATLTVNSPEIAPTLTKAFSPETIKTGEESVLTITLSNANGKDAKLSAPLTDNLPANMLVLRALGTTCGGTLTAIAGASTVKLTGGSIPAHGSCRLRVDVTAKYGGDHVNTLPIGALQTSLGSNVTAASATLTVTTIAPKLSKHFSPASIKTGGVSVLTITLTNPNSTAAAMTALLTDTLPSHLLVSGGASTTCGGALTAKAGGSTVTLSGGSIPENDDCTISVNVTGAVVGTYTNTLSIGALKTNLGNNIVTAVATLTVKAK